MKKINLGWNEENKEELNNQERNNDKIGNRLLQEWYILKEKTICDIWIEDKYLSKLNKLKQYFNKNCENWYFETCLKQFTVELTKSQIIELSNMDEVWMIAHSSTFIGWPRKK